MLTDWKDADFEKEIQELFGTNLNNINQFIDPFLECDKENTQFYDDLNQLLSCVDPKLLFEVQQDEGYEKDYVFHPTMKQHPDDDTVRPCISFTQILTRILQNSATQRLYLHEIYEAIMTNYSYYRKQKEKTWRNCVRHALSTNSRFLRIKESGGRMGTRGTEWCLRSSQVGVTYLEYLAKLEAGELVTFPFAPRYNFSTPVNTRPPSPQVSRPQSSSTPSSSENKLSSLNGPSYFYGNEPNPELFVITTGGSQPLSASPIYDRVILKPHTQPHHRRTKTQ